MWIYAVLLLPVIAAVAVVLYAWVRYYSVSTRWTSRVAPLPPAVENEASPGGEPCEFRTDDGLLLQGTYVRGSCQDRTGVVVFCHELFGNRWSAHRYMDALRECGFDILTFDFRNHGASDKSPTYEPKPCLTSHDLRDLEAAIDYACSRPDADPRGVALMGRSKGGNIALHTAADDDRVWTVIADSAFSTDWVTAFFLYRYAGIYTPLAPILRLFPWFLFVAYAKILQAGISRRMDVDTCDILDSAGRIRQPVLLVQGGRDSYVPVEMARTLVRRIGRNCKLWVVDGANHNGAIRTAPEKYADRIARFLLKQCMVEPSPRAVECATDVSVAQDSRAVTATV
jgi:pimeloyl-ACP methyl ester carboxylesterase